MAAGVSSRIIFVLSSISAGLQLEWAAGKGKMNFLKPLVMSAVNLGGLKTPPSPTHVQVDENIILGKIFGT